MKALEVYDILMRIGASYLHHANSTATSCTFLKERGLMSRALVHELGLRQTPQRSDEIDRKYSIWCCIFLDHVDIHDRGGAKKGPNRYGPVMFRFDLDVLLNLPLGSNIRVTKSNPFNWDDDDLDRDRWFHSTDQLSKSISFGDYEKMLVIATPSGRLDFPDLRASIILDDPRRSILSGENAYINARNLLRKAAVDGRVETSIEKRVCPNGCICQKEYAEFTNEEIDFYFT